jgi:hypothetical protein
MAPSVHHPRAAVPTYRQLTSQPASPSCPPLVPSPEPSRVGKPDAEDATLPSMRSPLFQLLLTLAIVLAFAALFWWDRLN